MRTLDGCRNIYVQLEGSCKKSHPINNDHSNVVDDEEFEFKSECLQDLWMSMLDTINTENKGAPVAANDVIVVVFCNTPQRAVAVAKKLNETNEKRVAKALTVGDDCCAVKDEAAAADDDAPVLVTNSTRCVMEEKERRCARRHQSFLHVNFDMPSVPGVYYLRHAVSGRFQRRVIISFCFFKPRDATTVQQRRPHLTSAAEYGGGGDVDGGLYDELRDGATDVEKARAIDKVLNIELQELPMDLAGYL